MSLRLISFLILLGIMPVMATANSNEPPQDSDGYYLLDSAEDLFWFAELSNNIDFSDELFNANAKLVNDITVNGDSFPWTPICSREQPSRVYTGTFDGQGYTISGLQCSIIDDVYDEEYVGFFGTIGYGGTVKNLGIKDSHFSNDNNVGGIAGWNKGGTVTNCYITDSSLEGYVVGGIVAINEEEMTISNCYSTVSCIVGYNYGTVSNCYSTVSGNDGIVDYNGYGNLSNCYYLVKEAIAGNSSAKTPAQFASGEVAYLLQGEQGNQVWGQNIDNGQEKQNYPVLSTENKVYQKLSVCGQCGYFNYEHSGYVDHLYIDGICGCRYYQEPELVDGVYQIANAGNLYWFANHVNNNIYNIDAAAKIVDNIDLNPLYTLNNDGTVTVGAFTYDEESLPDDFRIWTPIGTADDRPYIGTFDGNNKTISGLYYNDEHGYGGLFGYIGYMSEGAVIENLGVINSYIEGAYAGAIVAYHSYGGIFNCYNTGTVKTNEYAGGISAYFEEGEIRNCYSTGEILRSYEETPVGGIVGYDAAGIVSNCYYLKDDGGINSDIYGIGDPSSDDGAEAKTSAQFASGEVAYLLNGGQTGDWGQLIDPNSNNIYPILGGGEDIVVYQVYNECMGGYSYSNEYGDIEHNFDENGFCQTEGCISPCQEPTTDENGVYQITNAGNLYWFAALVNGTLTNVDQNKSANAKLTADIVVNEDVLVNGELNTDTEIVNTFRPWTPIGNSSSNSYLGSFDGQGHTVSGLYYNATGSNYVGLFGHIGFHDNSDKEIEAAINNVGVIDSYFKIIKSSASDEGKYIGGIVGRVEYGRITNCYNTSYIDGYIYVGGIVGWLNKGSILNCYNTGSVKVSSYYAGGIVGYTKRNTNQILNCYSTGSISGSDDENGINIGGIAGLNGGTILNCYSTASISGRAGRGGIVGGNETEGTVSNCYYLKENDINSGIYGIGGTDSDDTRTVAKTNAKFASGEVAYLLQGTQETQVWGQNIDNGQEKQDYPVFSEARVYRAGVDSYSNGCGDNVYWLYENCVLTIEGTGDMKDYAEDTDKPWSSHLSNINTVVVKAGITGIGSYAFSDIVNPISLFYYRSAQPTSWGNNWIKSGSTVYVPASDSWNGFSVEGCAVKSMPIYTGTWSTTPNANSHVVINSALVLGQQSKANSNVLTVSSFGLAESGSITIKAGEQTVDGQLIDNGGQLTCSLANGEVTVEKNITGNASAPQWYTISSPLKESVYATSVTNLIDETADNYALYRYDEPSFTWQNYKYQANNFTTLDAGRGYLYARSNSEVTTLQFTGDINTKPVEYKLTANGSTLSGIHLVGNPFTHDITYSNFTLNNAELASGYYVLTNQGAWGTCLANTDAIQQGQGALIKASVTNAANEATLTINPNATTNVGKGQQPRANSQQPMLSLNVTNGNYSDRAFVIFSEGVGLDKINHENKDIPLLYIPMSDADYAIAMMDENVSEIPVGFESSSMGEFTISLRQKNCEFEELYLLDKETGAKVNILEQDYTFMATSGDNPDRFILVKSQGSQPEAQSNFAYISNGDVVIYDVEGNAQIDIYDVLGRRVYNTTGRDDVHIVSTDGYSAGVYVIRLMDENGLRTQKVVIE